MEFREFLERQEQLGESLWGVAKGGWNTLAGAMTMGDEAISKMVGQGTKGRFRKGAGQVRRGLTQILVNDNPPGPEPAKPEPKREAPKPKPKRAHVTTPRPEPKRNEPKGLQRPLVDGEPRPNSKWLELAEKYENARRQNSVGAMRYIQFLMSQADPDYYVWLLQKLQKQKRRKKG